MGNFKVKPGKGQKCRVSNYVPPSVDIIEIIPEKGFAASGQTTDWEEQQWNWE